MKIYTEKEIEHLFTYHCSTHIEPKRFEEIRSAAKVLGLSIIKNGGSKVDIDKAINHLRKCVFFAIASIAIPDLQEK